MDQCPCINCLVYPICKVQVVEYVNLNKCLIKNTEGHTVYVNVLKPKCNNNIKVDN